MKVFRTAAVFMVLAGPALAQDGPHVNLLSDLPSKTPEEQAADQQREQAYKESLKKIPDAKTAADPWGGVRTQAAPAKTSASAKSKTKAGSNAN